jgi:hypothetical protein
MFRRFFAPKSVPLTGKPEVRRLKTYSAQSGYVYQYFYEGHRPLPAGSDSGTEFVFTVSADRKNWSPIPVLVSDRAVSDWELSHQRGLSSTERYAIAKMALFLAFDERTSPELMKQEIRVRTADVDAIIDTLGL